MDKIIAELREAENKATQGPWEYQEKSDAYTHIVRGHDNRFITNFAQDTSGQAESDARFLVAARNHLKVLLEHVESQAVALKQCGERIQAIQSIAEDAGKSSVADDLNTIIVFCDIALALPAVREAMEDK